MFPTLEQVVLFLEHYKYLVILPIAIFEGPIIIIISGFLIYLGYLNAQVAFLLLLVADMTGDAMYYAIGRFWRKTKLAQRFLKIFGFHGSNGQLLESHFDSHQGKTFLMAKFSHGIGAAVQLASGIARVKFSDFVTYSFIGTSIKTLLLLYIGFYIGDSYQKINTYLDRAAIVTILLFVVGIFLYYIFTNYMRGFIVKDKE